MAEDANKKQTWPYIIRDGASLKRAIHSAAAWIEAHAEEINALNVFPVPDGDTGTNMMLTCNAACEEMDRSDNSIPNVMRAVAHGSLMGARGNSGVILSQILRGMARSIDNKQYLRARDIALAFQEGASTAYKGVIKPVEGTILTVVRETSERAAVAVQDTEDMAKLMDSLVTAARQSVERTPTLLLALRQAGVVDAGGYGLYILLEGMQRHAMGHSGRRIVGVRRAAVAYTQAPEEGFGYDIQFIIHGTQLSVESIRARVDALGDSTLVVGDEKTIKVHVHAPSPGPVLDYAASLGPLTHIIVENLQQQYLDFAAEATGSVAPMQQLLATQAITTVDITGISTVVVASGAGFEKLFRSFDVTAIVPGGQTMNPSTQQILEAIEAAPTQNIVVLPNNKNIILTAEQARQISKKSVEVIPTKTIPQGIAALLALNYDSGLAENRQAMVKAAERVSTAEITRAVRGTHINGIHVEMGEIIGLVDDELVSSGDSVDGVAMSTIREMSPDRAELLTLYFGNGIQLSEATTLADSIRASYPSLEVEVLEGGQPHYMYIISAE